MDSKFQQGEKVRYVGDTKELQGLEGTVSDTAHNITCVYVTKGNGAYPAGSSAWPDTKNLEKVLPLSIGKADAVNSPSHYTRYPGIEVIQLTKHMDFCRGNAVKYLARAGHKDAAKELEDLKKAAWYTQCAIEKLEAEQSA